MAFCRGGTFAFGAEPKGEFRARHVVINDFYIDRAEVSNADYRRFVVATGQRAPSYWSSPVYDPLRHDDLPVVSVTIEEAAAYAHWMHKRLPTIFEWERAMRGPDALLEPVDGVATPDREVTLREWARAVVGTDAMKLAEYLAHMVSVRSASTNIDGQTFFHPCTNANEFTESVGLVGTPRQVVKGASWLHPPEYFTLTETWSLPLGEQSMKTGFRCARSAAPLQTNHLHSNTNPKGD
jgi:formylglycine-generating enzyme required for sulfatase activity